MSGNTTLVGVWLIAFLLGVHLLSIPVAEGINRLIEHLTTPRVPNRHTQNGR